MRRRAVFLVGAGGLLASVVAAQAYREGPLPRMTGGFGEPTCRSCHFDNPQNDPGGALSIDGIPSSFVAGREYAITVTVRRPGLARAGFEMTARFASGPREGEQAGKFRATGDRLQIVFAPGASVQYIQHTKTGSLAPAHGQARWTFAWTAPPSTSSGQGPGGGRVVFHAAANASNDDASPLGDFIYTMERASAAPR
jgi:hypothetical protein